MTRSEPNPAQPAASAGMRETARGAEVGEGIGGDCGRDLARSLNGGRFGTCRAEWRVSATWNPKEVG